MNIHDLLNSMTLKEKLGQMTQLPPHFFLSLSDTEVFGEKRTLYLSHDDILSTGSILGVGSAKEMVTIQSLILEKSRLKIPALFMADIIHGYQTIFPIPLAQAASFNPNLVKRMNEISALEASTCGIHVTFSPMVDLSRDARWGRVMEGFGEDPLLNQVMAKASIDGYHKGKPTDVGYLATCFKHFAAYGASESGRDYNSVDMSYERFHNLYRPSYQAAIDAKSEMVMLAFNTFNGVPSTINKTLTQNILKDTMHFKGVIISDYDALHQTIAHGAAKDDFDAARLGIEAGLDIEMASSAYLEHGEDLISKQKVSIDDINASVLKILELKQSLGLFEDPFKGASELREKTLLKTSLHFEEAEKLSYESPVLLKNDGVLPLKSSSKIALIGPFSKTRSLLGAWHWHGNIKDCNTYEETAKNLSVDVTYVSESLDINDIHNQLDLFDVILLMIGEPQHESGEAKSKVGIHIDPNIKTFIDYANSKHKPVVAVIHGGRPLVLDAILDANAIMMTWFLGSRHTEVVMKLLLGLKNPSGKLPMSFPRHVGQLPLSYHDFNTGRPYDPIHNEYTTKYLDVHLSPLFVFGFGLSYTKMNIKVHDIKTHWDGIHPLEITYTMTNSNDISGDEVIQVYGSIHPSIPVRPLKKLISYEKIHLKPFESKTQTIKLFEKDFILYNESGNIVMTPGTMTLHIGFNPYELHTLTLEWSPS